MVVATVWLPRSMRRKSKQKLVKIPMVEKERNFTVERDRGANLERSVFFEKCRGRWKPEIGGWVKSERKIERGKSKYKWCSLKLSQIPILMTDHLNHPRKRIRIAIAVVANKRLRVAVSAFIKRARSLKLSDFDAIAPPKSLRGFILGGINPVLMKEDGMVPLLTSLSILALDKYNEDNKQDPKFVFDKLVKSTCEPCSGMNYFITFKAKAAQLDTFNTPATIFQASVWHRLCGLPPLVEFCVIKT